MNKNILILILSVLTLSCSKDNIENDVIIGKWQPIEIYEAGIKIEMPVCFSLMFTEYKTDQTFYSGFLSNDLPEECRTIDFALYTWKKIGDGKYNTRFGQEAPQLIFVRKQEGNLIIESPAENKVTFYKPI